MYMGAPLLRSRLYVIKLGERRKVLGLEKESASEPSISLDGVEDADGAGVPPEPTPKGADVLLSGAIPSTVVRYAHNGAAGLMVGS